MGVGPQYVLDKGFVLTGSTAYKFGECVVINGDGTKCARATSAAALVLGVSQENIDAAKLTTGKVVHPIRLLGISRVLTGGAVAVGAKVTNDTSARAVTGGAAGTHSFGIALTASTGAGQYIDVLLTPGNTM
jgi:hypothetical protein